jgi:hypothetical protein
VVGLILIIFKSWASVAAPAFPWSPTKNSRSVEPTLGGKRCENTFLWLSIDLTM